MSTAVFPVGHYGGVRAAADGPAHVIRVGFRQHLLTQGAFAVWVLAHGLSEHGKDPWTWGDVITQTGQAAETDAHLTELLDRDLLAVVPLGPAAAGFARTHRLNVLFVGLGNSPERPDRYAVGVPGLGTAALLDPDCYELWQWGSLAPTLWHTCKTRSSATGSVDPAQALGGLLGDLRVLLVHGCSYLDVVD